MQNLIIPGAAVLVLLFFSAFFSGSETALTAASKSRLHTLEKEGNKRAALVNKIRSQKERMIGALLLGNNLVNILASALATSVMIVLVGEAGVVYATLVMTLLVLIFAEVLPKTYALHHAENMSMTIAPVMRVVIIILAPITAMVTGIVRAVMKIFGTDISKVDSGSHVDILRGAIDLHRGTNPDEETDTQRAMLRSILDLADVELREIMTHRKDVIMIDASLPPEKIIKEALDSPYSRLPLWREDTDNIVGIIHVKALLKAIQENGGKARGIDIESISTDPWFVPETTTLFDQLQEFRRRRAHFALVIDEYGGLEGIVTLEDVLEEIVGEIEDETDEDVAGVQLEEGGSYLVDGAVTIRDLNREFEWELPDEDYATVAGLILHEAQVIPEPGQSFSFFGLQFDVLKRHRNRISLLRVWPPLEGSEEEDDI